VLLCSAKSEGPIPYECELERDYYQELDFDVYVKSIKAQPVTILYTDSFQKQCKYTPDALIHYHQDCAPGKWLKPRLLEFKQLKDLKKNKGKYEERFEAAKHYANQRGWEFQVLTEREVYTAYNINARFLRGFYPYTLDSVIADYIRGILISIGQCSISSLLVITAERYGARLGLPERDPNDPEELRALILSAIWKMMSDRTIQADLNRPLDLDTEVWSIHGGNEISDKSVLPVEDRDED
jgi:hypothetical protein